MEFFKANTKIDFMGQRGIAAVFSAIIFIGSIIALSVNGLNLGLDFTGGYQVVASFTQPAPVNQIRENLKTQGFRQATVTPYNPHEISIRIGIHKGLKSAELKRKLNLVMPKAHIGQFEYIGPEVGKQLMTNGVLAILLALLGTMAYIAIRFEYRFALSAALALIHDPMLILGVFALFHIEFNMIGLTALLTVIGYSLNDTVVVYDRVRECFRKVRKGTPIEIMNLSINETLSRTIMTSGLTLMAVLALFFYGGEVIHAFSLAMIIGIVIGTYSSIYVAGSLAVMFGLNRANLMPAPKVKEDSMP